MKNDIQYIQFAAKIEYWDKVSSFLSEFMTANEIGGPLLEMLLISAEEIFINIAKYAYGDPNGNVEIIAERFDNPRRLIFTFKDSGRQYNPLNMPNPNLILKTSDREVGGLGIFIVKKNMDLVEYRYESGQNILSIVKFF